MANHFLQATSANGTTAGYQFILPGIIFLLTLGFGFWLSRLGKPYNSLIFNVHKLIALGAVIITIQRLSLALREAKPTTLIIILLCLAALSVMLLFVSGALMSANKWRYNLMLTAHRVASPILVISMALTLWFLLRP